MATGTGIYTQPAYTGIGHLRTPSQMDFTPKYDYPTSSALGGLQGMAMLKKGNIIGQVGTDVAQQGDMAMEGVSRRLQEMGVNPSAGRYVGSLRASAIDTAANKAGAMTRAGQGVDEANFQRMSGLAGLQMQQNRDNMGWQMQAGQQGLSRENMYLQNLNKQPNSISTSIRLPSRPFGYNSALAGSGASFR